MPERNQFAGAEYATNRSINGMSQERLQGDWKELRIYSPAREVWEKETELQLLGVFGKREEWFSFFTIEKINH